ncbi:hypothetical protein [Paenarthrobacter nitroguajacolicus]|uniref:hypothetical protein n=1 Tax=Paenarthrobacter nitroguajacolicus TaxID=211146 RepID=UPI00248A9711|nr:hypothetical protein [Paenarthrobacter nitroguajacolicus]MDI2032975.1 hypothetical protein [Paenarthrobacter nitroguajacolicus]
MTSATNPGTVISLCDLTGNMTEPWVDAGYHAFLVDPQHGETSTETRHNGAVITRFAGTVEGAIPAIARMMSRGAGIAMVFGFPPCTDMAVSGARWFKTKHEADKLFQAKAVMVAEQCRTIGRLSGAPWFVENPVSVLASAFGKPQYTFHPADFTAYEPCDNYTKKTCLWTGGGFIMPAPHKDETLGAPDNRIHFASPGPDRANFRSATPMGFARAVFDANRETSLSLRTAA